MSEFWNPTDELPTVDNKIIKYGAGFLCSRPDKWFPGISSDWIPLFNSLNINTRVLSIKPGFDFPDIDLAWNAVVNGEDLYFACNSLAAAYAASQFVPGVKGSGARIIEEYMVRRIIGSVINSWSGPALSGNGFKSEVNITNLQGLANIQLNLLVNEREISVYFFLGEKALKTIDGLWRRQTNSLSAKQMEIHSLELEFGRLAIDIARINETLVSGKIVELKTDKNVFFSENHQIISTGRLYQSENKFVFQVDTVSYQPEGEIEVRIVFGTQQVDFQQYEKLTKEGSYIETAIELSHKVELKVAAETVGQGEVLKEGDKFLLRIL